MPGHELILHPVVGGFLTPDDLAAAADLHRDLVDRFVAYGLLEPARRGGAGVWFDGRAVARLRTVCRLREDLGINLPGIAVVLDLLDRIAALRGDPAGPRRGNWERGG
ncbi:MAG: hypothetical protein JWO38_7313 [Gemmataceae bacterium]|nr:hypothetical protein [Gemmataceae bacterium]